jgi:hypothetical protein
VSRLFLIVTMSVMVLIGCATTSPQQAEEVSASQVFTQGIWNRAPSEHEGTVVLVRASQFTGIACTYSVLVDGSEIAEIDNGQKITLNLFEGQHVVSAQMGQDSCGHSYAEYRVQVKPGSREMLLVEVGTFDGLTIKPYQ